MRNRAQDLVAVLTLIVLVSWVPFLFGADCEQRRLESLDHGRLERNGLELVPVSLPFEVIGAESVEQPEAFTEAIDQANTWLGLTAFYGCIDQEAFERLDQLPGDARLGTVTVRVGALPTPGWYEDDPQPGGVASLSYDDEGRILWADIVIDHEHAYHADTFRRRLLHELGHVLGLAHDGQSLDLNSCMTSPPHWGCTYTEHDRELVREAE